MEEGRHLGPKAIHRNVSFIVEFVQDVVDVLQRHQVVGKRMLDDLIAVLQLNVLQDFDELIVLFFLNLFGLSSEVHGKYSLDPEVMVEIADEICVFFLLDFHDVHFPNQKSVLVDFQVVLLVVLESEERNVEFSQISGNFVLTVLEEFELKDLIAVDLVRIDLESFEIPGILRSLDIVRLVNDEALIDERTESEEEVVFGDEVLESQLEGELRRTYVCLGGLHANSRVPLEPPLTNEFVLFHSVSIDYHFTQLALGVSQKLLSAQILLFLLVVHVVDFKPEQIGPGLLHFLRAFILLEGNLYFLGEFRIEFVLNDFSETHRLLLLLAFEHIEDHDHGV